MIQWRERLLWLGLAVLAGYSGVKVSGLEAGAEQSEISLDRRTRADRPGNAAGDSRRDSARSEKELRELAVHALSTPSRTERFQKLMAMLDETTEDNWMVFWNEYIGQTLNEGRVHETEWSLFMNRVGEVAGPRAMEYFTHNAQNEYTFNRREVLRGWATVDPQGAHAWLKSQPEEDSKPEFWQAVLSGAVAVDSKLALDWLADVPAAHADSVIRGTVDGLIQTEGLANSIRSLEGMAAAVSKGGELPNHLRVFYGQLRERARRMDWLRESYPQFEGATPSMESLDQVFSHAVPGN